MINLLLKFLIHCFPVIILKTYIFKSKIYLVLFGTHSVLDESLRVLQLPTFYSLQLF